MPEEAQITPSHLNLTSSASSGAKSAFSSPQSPSPHEHALCVWSVIMPVGQVRRLRPMEGRRWVCGPAAGQGAGCGWVIPHPTAVYPSRRSRAFLLPPPQAPVSSRPTAPGHLLAPPRSCSASTKALRGDRVEAELAASQDLNGDSGAFF